MTLSRFNKGFASVGTLMIMMLSFPFASSIFMKQQTVSQIYRTADEAPKMEVALVLGAAAYPTRLSAVLQDRVDTAIELYEQGKVKKLLMTGAPNEVVGMRDYALEHEVATEDIIEDPAGLNTIASIRNASSYDKMTIVTQAFHLPRALFMAKHFGIEAVGVASDRREYTRIFDFKKRELLASTKAILDLYWR